MSAEISAYVFICENAIEDKTSVLSAFRIVDVFYVPPQADLPEVGPKIGVSLHILGSIKVLDTDSDEHAIELRVRRLNSDKDTPIGEPVKRKFSSDRVPEAPPSINIHAILAFVPKQAGVHRVVLLLDGTEVANTLFTIAERPADSDVFRP